MSVFTEQEFENYWRKYESNQKKFQDRLLEAHRKMMNPLEVLMEQRHNEYKRRAKCD